MDKYTGWLKMLFNSLHVILITNRKILKRLDDIYFLLEEEKKNNNKYKGE